LLRLASLAERLATLEGLSRQRAQHPGGVPREAAAIRRRQPRWTTGVLEGRAFRTFGAVRRTQGRAQRMLEEVARGLRSVPGGVFEKFPPARVRRTGRGGRARPAEMRGTARSRDAHLRVRDRLFRQDPRRILDLHRKVPEELSLSAHAIAGRSLAGVLRRLRSR